VYFLELSNFFVKREEHESRMASVTTTPNELCGMAIFYSRKSRLIGSIKFELYRTQLDSSTNLLECCHAAMVHRRILQCRLIRLAHSGQLK
jgi:hypothetical protein